MEAVENVKQGTGKKSGRTSQMKKLDTDTMKLLGKLSDQANKKDYGRRVRDGEIISFALKLVTPDHIKELQEKTISGKDRLQIAFQSFQKKNGKSSFEDFIGTLLGSGVENPS